MMGKSTGFLEYDRVTSRSASPKERIKDFDEFHLVDKGVRIFQEGVKIEKGIESSKAAERTGLTFTDGFHRAVEPGVRASERPRATYRLPRFTGLFPSAFASGWVRVGTGTGAFSCLHPEP